VSYIAGSHDGCYGRNAVMSYSESPVVFECEGDRLIGVIAKPFDHQLKTGVLIVVGGPQYRAGSHRQFTLLARDLACDGIASLRFDYRGMGDSEGAARTFEAVDDDIAAAIDVLFLHVPALTSVIIWGLCDAASAALIYAHRDRRVSGLILLNPWSHSDESGARARLEHYYLRRLIQPSLWVKLVSGKFRLRASARDLVDSARAVIGSFQSTRTDPERLISSVSVDQQPLEDAVRAAVPDFISRMLNGLRHFKGNIFFILSGNDLTAAEFISLIERHRGWRNACQHKRISREYIVQANHTFSTREWRDQVTTLTIRVARSCMEEHASSKGK
jgi:uncharacterized protein